MSSRLNVPADLASLIERREGGDRRASGEGRNDEDRRQSGDPPTQAAPTKPDDPIALGDVTVPSELLERRKEGARRDQQT